MKVSTNPTACFVLCAAVLAACSDSTTPAPPLDSAAITDLADTASDALEISADRSAPDVSDAPSDAVDGSAPDGAGGRCAPDVDSDGDGITNDRECADGTDPLSPDTDMDGLSDGVERRYPRVCVATDRARQRRPPTGCASDAGCMAGENCRGLDPLVRDSDMDGLVDGIEDPTGDGTIDVARGESDPRLWDTDGDGVGDGMSGLSICRAAGLATVVQSSLPSAATQVGYDPAWRTARRLAGTMGRSVMLLDDATAGVAALVAAIPATADVRVESNRVERVVDMSLGAGFSRVLVERNLTTHEGNPAVTSTFRVARAASASALRDAIVSNLTGAAAPPTPAYGVSSEFLVDVTTVRRTMGAALNVLDVVVTIAPKSLYDDASMPAATRVTDLVNSTALAESNKGLGFHCQRMSAPGAPRVDFVWTVDTSLSMGPHQDDLGDAAVLLFGDLNAAGVDFRIAVLQAQSAPFNFATPGLRFISGGSATGPRELAFTVTAETFHGMTADTLHPYGNDGSLAFDDHEEPLAAGILAFEALLAAPSTAPEDQRFRPGATLAAFFVADETGTNDDSRFFARDETRWGTTYAEHLLRATEFFRSRRISTFGLVNDEDSNCSARGDMRRCFILANNGAYIPIRTASTADVAAAMQRVVAAIVGASSPYRLERSPITSTLKVSVRGVNVPRSRADGFDYDQAANTVVFRGATYRPRMGDEVVISYRLWQPCPTLGATCTASGECCAPQECVLGRCAPPCERLGAACARDGDCCAPNLCVSGRCAPPTTCRPSGGTCTVSAECCAPNACAMGRCTEPVACRPAAAACASNADCCSATCTMGRCAPPPCRPILGMCTSPADCCSGSCSTGQCSPG